MSSQSTISFFTTSAFIWILIGNTCVPGVADANKTDETGEPKSLVFADENRFKEFLKQVDQALSELLDSTNYNTVDPYITFYDAFKTHFNANGGKRDFDKFFKQYHLDDSRPRETCASMSKGLIDRLAELENEFHGVINAGYLASARIRIPDTETDHNTIRMKNHSVALFKVSVEGNDGYIVLDPGFAAETAAVVMKDPQSHLNRLSTKSVSNIFEYKYHINEKIPYIQCKVSKVAFYTPITKIFNPAIEDTYFFPVNEWYSLKDTSEEFDLLDEFKIIRRRLPQKTFVGIAFFTQYSSVYKNFSSTRACYPFTIVSDGMQYIGPTIPFKTLFSANESSSEMKSFDYIEKTLGYQKSALLDKMKRIATILDNDGFRLEARDLDRSINYERISKVDAFLKSFYTQ